jgi:hypothetical protein
MNTFLIVIGLLLAIVMSSLFVWILMIKLKEEKQPSDDLIFEHFLPQYTDGHTMGNVIDIIKGSKRTGIKFLPRDIDYVRLATNEKKGDIKPLIVWISNDKLIYSPKGSHSSHRHKLWGFPVKAEDFSEDFKKTYLGGLFMKMTEEANSKTEEVDVLRKRVVNQNKMVNMTEGLELVDDALSKIMEINKSLVKATNDRGGKTQNTFSSGISQHGQ